MTGVFSRRIEAMIAGFIRRRTPTRSTPMTIGRRRLYILPTRSGAIFAVLLVVMLLGATNYSNSLAFALTFWLAAIALVSMHHAHANLVGLRLSTIHAGPVFAGDTLKFDITLDHANARRRRALQRRSHARSECARASQAQNHRRCTYGVHPAQACR